MDLSTRDGRRQQGERIKRAARDAGLSLDYLARLIGCSRALIFQYASGASLIQTDRLQQIAEVVGRPLYWFFLDQDGAIGADDMHAQERATAQTAKLQLEREQFELERARHAQKLQRDEIAYLELLIAASSSGPDQRKVVEFSYQLQPLIAREDDPERMAALLLKLGNALIQLQEWGAAKQRLEQAAELYRSSGKPALERDCIQSIAHANMMLGRVAEALKQFEYVSTSDDWTNRWQGALSIGAAKEVLGDYDAAVTAFENAMQIVAERSEGKDQDASSTQIPCLYIEANWANLEIDFGDFRQALARANRCSQIAQRHGIQDQYLEALLNAGVALLNLVQIDEAIDTLSHARDLAQLTADQQRVALALAAIGQCCISMGQRELAIEHGKEALAIALRCGVIRAEIAAQRTLAEAYLASGRKTEAGYHASQGHAAAHNHSLPLTSAQFNLLIARAAQDRNDQVLQQMTECLEVSERLGVRPLQVEAHFALAWFHFCRGELAASVYHAVTLTQLAQAMELQGLAWAGRALGAIVRYAENLDPNAAAVTTVQNDLLLGIENAAYSLRDILLGDNSVSELLHRIIAADRDLHGRDHAMQLALELDWPPLLDWAESNLPQ